MIKYYVDHKTYRKFGRTWMLDEDYGTEEISEATYLKFKYEHWKGDRRTFKYINGLGDMLTQLSTTEPTYKRIKSVRIFSFEIVED